MQIISKFIEESISSSFPPVNPILRNDWSAFAFDRNRYENFAPDAVWEALFLVHNRVTESSKRVGVISSEEIANVKPPKFIGADIPSIRAYWSEDARFLFDHYIFSPSYDWLIRIDQDVTLIAGKSSFLREVVAELGGLEGLLRQMTEDFDPGESDSAGLKQYLASLTTHLRD